MEEKKVRNEANVAHICENTHIISEKLRKTKCKG